MDPFTIMFLVSSGLSIAGGLSQSRAQADQMRRQAQAAEVNAFNVDTQKIQNDAIALQRSNDRYRDFKLAESANRALLTGAMGRDIGGSDRSVAAFLKRNRETAYEDMDRITTQGQMEGLNIQMEAAGERMRAADLRMGAKSVQQSGVINAFTSAATTMMRYDAIAMPTGAPTGAPTGYAPTSSPRPAPRPF